MRTFSKKRQRQNRDYVKKRNQFLEENPVCMYPGCESEQVTLHHAKGRIGALLTDETHFKALCFGHHREVEENPARAKELGLSVNRLVA